MASSPRVASSSDSFSELSEESESPAVSRPGEEPVAGPLEHFIPVRKADLLSLLLATPGVSEEEQTRIAQLAHWVAADLHSTFLARLDHLKDAYAPFDPDADTLARHLISDAERERRASELFDHFVELLERANFRRLERSDIEQAMTAASHWGVNLSVDFDRFQRLEVFARGDGVGRRVAKLGLIRKKPVEIEVPVYRRLVVIFRLTADARIEDHVDDETIYLKVFKNIPKMDLEMLLPGTQVRMTLADRGRIFIPTISAGMFTLFKLIQAAAAMIAAGFTLAFLGVVGGTLGYGLRSFHGYTRTRQRYQLNLTRSLYYQNLDNNAGVIYRLLDEAEEQEFREILLAWFFLFRERDSGSTEVELDRAIEEFLAKHIDLRVDFEIQDALSKLERMGLAQVEVGVQAGKWRALSPERCRQALEIGWRSRFANAASDPETSFDSP